MENEPNFFSRVEWRRKDIIRNVKTATPYKVLHVFLDICTLAVDLTSKDELLTPIVILPKDYNRYCKDSDLRLKTKGEEMEWSLERVNL